MSSSALRIEPVPQPVAAPKQAVVRWRYLFSFYAVIPFLFALMLFDTLILHGQIRNSFIKNPDDSIWFRLVFNLPHIMAGNLLMMDREYISHYRKSIMIPGLLIAFGLFPLIDATAGEFYAYLLFDFMTIWHTWQQQVGLNRVLLKENLGRFQIWGVVSFIIVLAGYMELYATTEVPPLPVFVRVGLVALAVVLFAIGLTFAPRGSMGRKFVFLNGSLTVFGSCTLMLGYPLFAILGYRIIHDFTAFYIYSVHDINRNAVENKNFATGFMAKLRVPPSLRLVVLALVLSAGVSIYEQDIWFCEYIVISSSFFHYFMETYVWRGPQLHRKYTPFVA